MTEAHQLVSRIPPKVEKTMREVQALANQTNSMASRIDRWGDQSETRIVCKPGGDPWIEVVVPSQHEAPFFVLPPSGVEPRQRRWWQLRNKR